MTLLLERASCFRFERTRGPTHYHSCSHYVWISLSGSLRHPLLVPSETTVGKFGVKIRLKVEISFDGTPRRKADDSRVGDARLGAMQAQTSSKRSSDSFVLACFAMPLTAEVVASSSIVMPMRA